MTDENPKAGKTLFINSLWAILTRAAMRLLGAISIVILARILTPDDYGVIALAMMIISILETMTSMGLSTALITNQNATKEHYNTVWTLHVLQGLLIGGALAALAIPAANYFKSPELEAVMYCYAVFSVIFGFYNVGVIDFRKKLKFNLEFKYQFYCKVASFVATIIAAFILRSYWALVIGVAVNYIVKLILSYTMSPYRPSFCLSKWRELFHFSKWMMIHSISSSVTWEVDSFLLARLSNTRTLGVFTVAGELAETPTVELGTSVASAMSPSLAKLNDNPENFKALYQKSLGMLLLVSAPAGVGISVLAEELTMILLGDKWLEAIPFVEILALVGVLSMFTSNSISALISSGRIKVLACLSTARFFIRTSILFVGFYYFGVYGFLLAMLIAMVVYVLMSLTTQRYYELISVKKLFDLCWRSITATTFMYFFLKALQDYLYSSFSMNEYMITAFIVFAGAIAYTSCVLALWIMFGKNDGPEKEVLTFIKNR